MVEGDTGARDGRRRGHIEERDRVGGGGGGGGAIWLMKECV